jgi:hypothetical protein
MIVAARRFDRRNLRLGSAAIRGFMGVAAVRVHEKALLVKNGYDGQ